MNDKTPSTSLEQIFSSESLGGLSDSEKIEIQEIVKNGSDQVLNQEFVNDIPEAKEIKQEGGASDSTDIRTLLSKMRLPEKVKAGLFGNATCRAILIREGNKLIQHCVLKNPKLTEKEVEEFARNPHLSDFALRIIGESRVWTSNSIIRRNLVMNPKTPPAISLRYIRTLQANDLKLISRSKGLPTVIVTTARKLILAR